MIGAVIENFIGGYLHPRASVRRLLAGRHGPEVAVRLVLLAYLVRQIFFAAMPGMRAALGGGGFAWYVGQLIEMAIVFGILTMAAYGIGRLFGGRGTPREAALVIAWYLLVTSFIDPLLAAAWMQVQEAARQAAEVPGASVALPGGAVVTLVVLGGLALWLMASYVAELHRFRSTLAVLGVMLGLSFLIGFVVRAILPGA